MEIHILSNEQSVVRQLTSRINGLTKVCTRASKGTRLKVANGIFISKLCYLIELWGGCEGYLLTSLQVIQNRAARAVTRKSWFTSTRSLLKDCRWLSVEQLVVDPGHNPSKFKFVMFIPLYHDPYVRGPRKT